ncbi:hypothetical protein [Modestobacter sp. Leaf380]|uniref:hypothetical protein n=1 Tax=Modestobacter sp. Leaf380 TaxID=1736356 RepID=UPI0006FF9806|nr:hypothetical protein [Modestobacter sp. Leaf380]KQS64828.1 hypothetical protein ASG41_15255 [Modestobacter sp. Leaf380]
MRIRPTELDAIVGGTLDLAFRRWDRPRLLVGTRMRTRVGLVEVTSLDRVDPDDLTEDDARRAGAASLEALRHGLADDDRPVFRVGLRFAGEDPRAVLRRTPPTPAEVGELQARLDRLDRASATGPWTAQALQLVDAHPERRAPELAAEAGRPTADFKRDVRKLKELGLTESLDIGYRLSARGEAVVDAARRAAGGRARRRAARPAGTPLPSIGAPATRALRAAGLATLEAVAGLSDAELLAMHGVGPIAVTRLRAALAGPQPDSRAQSAGPSATG